MVHMFRFDAALRGGRNSKEINVDHVRDYGLMLPERHSKEYRLRFINPFKYSNIFRKLFGFPLKKPRRFYWCQKPHIIIEWSNGHQTRYHYSSNRMAIIEYNKFNDFMWDINEKVDSVLPK